MANVKISILTEFLGKGMKDADKSVKGLERSVKNLGYLFGGGYLGAKILSFSKTAVRAFVADDKAAQTLSRTLTNLGLAFEDVRVSSFIQDLQNTYGVLDDQLRPAFQRLLTTTGSVTEAQAILRNALDLSAAGFGDVVSISGDLSKAYVGQTRALAKYGLGLTQAELKGMKFEEVQARINKLFAGQAAIAADSYSGKIDKLTAAAADATEIIGEGLVDALGKAFGSGTGDRIDNTANKIRNLGKVGNAVINTFADVFQATFDTRAYLEQSRAGKPADKNAIIPSIAAELSLKVFEDRLKLIREEAAASAKLTKDKQKQLMLEKAKLALTKAAANFDITKINLAAALKGKVSEEDRKRLLALQAIENDNGELALKYISELEFARKQAADAEEERQRRLHEAQLARMQMLQDLMDKIQRKKLYNIEEEQRAVLTAQMSAAQALAAVLSANSSASSGVAGYSGVGSGAYDVVTNPFAGTYYGETGRDPMPLSVNISLDGQAFQSAVVGAVNQASASGTQLSYTQTAVR